MRTSHGGGRDQELLAEVLERWRGSLIDLSGRNRLLNFRQSGAATLELEHPALIELVRGLGRGIGFVSLPETEPGLDPAARRRLAAQHPRAIVTQKATEPALRRALNNLRTKSTQVFNDYGLWTLQIGVGMLNWRDDPAQNGCDAPLILMPAMIEITPKGEFRLRLNDDDDPRHNPALNVKLEQLQLDWSKVIAVDPLDIPAVLAAARAAVSDRRGWSVADRVVLAQFASHKEAMYKDLLDNEKTIVTSDLVRAVALGPRATLAADRFDFQALDLARVDELSPPEATPLVLDADASQRQAVAAAIAGRSFVLDGPPGTGKSQTITNMIAGLLHSGRTVLFVSEKAAALDVVLDRLRATGLDSYALALHSHNTSRKAVAQELGHALTQEPSASVLAPEELSALRTTRTALSDYAVAMNEVRKPLGASLHDVMGMVGRLSGLPLKADLLSMAGPLKSVTVKGFRPADLRGEDLRSIVDAAETITSVWPVMVDRTHIWRGLRTDVRNPCYVLERAQTALGQLTKAAEEFRALTDNSPAADDAMLARLTNLLELLPSRPPLPEPWLTSPDSTALDEQVKNFQRQLRALRRSHEDACAAAGSRWEELPGRLNGTVPQAERHLANMSPRGVDPASYRETDLRRLSLEFASTAIHLDELSRMVTEAAELVGLEVPNSVEAIRDLCELLELSVVEHPPLEAWLVPNAVDKARKAAARVVAERLDEFFTRRDEARTIRDLALAVAGIGWRTVSPELSVEIPEQERALTALTPTGLDIAGIGRIRAGELGVRFDLLARTLDAADSAAKAGATQLGCTPPTTTEQAEDLIALMDSAASEHRALVAWFDPAVMVIVHQLLDEIASAIAELAAARKAAESYFVPGLVDVDMLPGAVAELLDGPRGMGGLFSRRVRAARRVIASVTVSGLWQRELYENLPLAAEWYAAHERLRELVRENAGLLGRYVVAGMPDIDALRAACAHADLVHRLASVTSPDPDRRDRLAGQLADGCAISADVRQRAVELRDSLTIWRGAVASEPLSDYADDLTKQSLDDVARWLRAHRVPLRDGCAMLDIVATERGLNDLDAARQTLRDARNAIDVAQRAQWATAEFEAAREPDRRLLGPWYQGLDTDLSGVGKKASPMSVDFPASELLRRAGAVRRSARTPLAEVSDAVLLGDYATDLDIAALWQALEVARAVVRLAADTIADPARRDRLSSCLSIERIPGPDLCSTADRLKLHLELWESQAGAPDNLSFGAALVGRSPESAARWLRSHIEPFEDAADLVAAFTRVVGGDRTVSGVRTAVSAVAQARSMRAEFEDAESRWCELLGALYTGMDTCAEDVDIALDWADKVRRVASGGRNRALTTAAARLMLTCSPRTLVPSLHRKWKECRSDLADCFESNRDSEIRVALEHSLPRASEMLGRFAEDEHGPEKWQLYAEARAELGRFGLAGLPVLLAERGVDPADLPATIERSVLAAWVDQQLADDPRLRPHRAAERDRLVQTFRAGDRELVGSAHATVIAACNERRPRRVGTGPAAVIRQEAQKRARHMPVRMLLGQTREVVQRIKPCFMMSPLTVSQFLPPDFHFDVVIFDEASQVLPQDAVNSIYRGNSLIVAGDQKQLPPTSFFTVAGGNDDEEWSETDTTAFESVLDLCKGSGVLRSLSLGWHYRSRHEHLIAFSNHEFYGDAMVTFPGVLEEGPDIGVVFLKADGIYGRGKGRDNPGEAALVAQRVLYHAETRPHLSLGVVALSKPQAEAIENAIGRARLERPDLDHFFTEDRLNGFFVKNLETVQGDERDVIVLSIGYGPDEHGKMRSVFGPINNAEGWRRLNVAITRARRRVEVIASFHGADLPESNNPSVQFLKRYLMFAERGPQVLALDTVNTDGTPHGPFEEDVLNVLEDWGYEVQPQVGVAAYRIDMAIRHPDAPGVFALGIECDGAMYHSSRAARDRDRLRDNVLRDLGWRLYRVWSIDWHRDRTAAMARLRTAVEAACAIDPHYATRPEIPGSVLVEDHIDFESKSAAVEFVPVEVGPVAWVRPYQAVTGQLLADLRHRVAKELRVPAVLLQDPAAAGVIAEVAMRVVREEGPIEESVIIARVRSAWGFQRAGRVVQEAVRKALDSMVRGKKVTRHASTYDLPNRTITFVRAPADDYVRKVGEVPPSERQLALRKVIDEVPGARVEEVLREVAEIFGWTRLGADIRSQLTWDIAQLVRRGEVEETRDGRLI